MTESTWSLGVLIGLPITILLVLASVGVIVWAVIAARREHDPELFWLVGGIFGIAPLVITLGVALSPLGFYPYEAQYHRWEPVQGTVSEIERRIVSSGNSMAEKFVVRYEDSQQEYGCEDTRCAVVEPGDVLVLTCKRAWQYAGVDGYDCRYVASRGRPS